MPDIADPNDYDDKVIREPMNLYSIASPKANVWTGMLLESYGQSWVPELKFRADPASDNLRNILVSLYHDDALLQPPGYKLNVEGDRYHSDIGVIVRGPNPYHESQMLAILAGRSSLGTEAACTAFTDVDRIGEIQRRLGGLDIDLEDHKQAFWALVSMNRAVGDGKEEAIAESLQVHQVAAFHRRE